MFSQCKAMEPPSDCSLNYILKLVLRMATELA